MKPTPVDTWLEDLLTTLTQAADLADHRREAFDDDPALPCAFKAPSNRIGKTSKRMYAAASRRFSDHIWSQAARNPEVRVRHYDRLDLQILWVTVTITFQTLERIAPLNLASAQSDNSA